MSLSNWSNKRANGRKAEYVTVLPSCTIPDQSYTIAQVKARYQRGQPLPGSALPPIYTGDADYIDINRLDKVERAELMRKNKERIGHVRNEMASREAKRKKQEYDAAVQAKVDEALRARQDRDEAVK